MKIYDCFQFFNELEILEFRLELLYKVVDFFVLVECRKTHMGHDKPLYYLENKERFSKYNEKIIYVLLDDLPKYLGEGDFGNIEYMRDQIMRGLAGKCMPDDLVLISDVDEIPNPDILKDITKIKVDIAPKLNNVLANIVLKLRYLSNANKKEIQNILTKRYLPMQHVLKFTPIEMEEDLFYYYMNCKSKGKWHSTVLSLYSVMMMPNIMRQLSMSRRLPVIHKAGWHFSYLGGIEAVKQKLNELIDDKTEVNAVLGKYKNNDEYIGDCLNRGIDMFGRKGKVYEYSFIDEGEIGLPNITLIKSQHPCFFRERED